MLFLPSWGKKRRGGGGGGGGRAGGGGGAKNRGEMGGNSLKLSNIETECQNETECPVFTLNCHTLHPGCGYQSPIIKDLQQEGDHLNMR